MDSSQQPIPPQRLSALYQYHNAPEVAPTQGLEFDDTIYPVSDKYPVIHHDAPGYEHKYTGKHAFESDNRPPRIIFGMKVKTFLLVAALVVCIVVGAAVGGAVGGKHMNSDSGAPVLTAIPSSSSTPTSTAITSTYAAPTPTYSPLSDCPESNATLYNSTLLDSTSTSRSGLSFEKFCDLTSPLSASSSGSGSASSGANNITGAFTYTFNDCIELCASLNFYASNDNCTIAVYEPAANRPTNCYVGYTSSDVRVASLTESDGTDVALLKQS